MSIWHKFTEKPQKGRWVLTFYPPTKTPSLHMAHDCIEIMAGCVWAYVQDLLKVEQANE